MIPADEPIDLPKAAKPRPSLVEVRADVTASAEVFHHRLSIR
jgi:hypothetical protein